MDFEKEINKELKKLGERVHQLRMEKGLTQLDLSSRCIIDRADISRIEHGEMNIKFSSLVQLAIALEVSISDFFVEE